MEVAAYLTVLTMALAGAAFVYSAEKGWTWAMQLADGLARQETSYSLTVVRRPARADRLENANRVQTLRPKTVDSVRSLLIPNDHNGDRAA